MSLKDTLMQLFWTLETIPKEIQHLNTINRNQVSLEEVSDL